MKTINKLLVLLSIIISVACQSDSQRGKYTLNCIPYEDGENDGYGLLNSDGTCFLSKLLKDSPTPIINEYFAIEEDGLFSLCKLQNSSYEKIADCGGLSAIGVMNDGLIPVCKENEHIRVLNANGRLEFSLDSISDIEVAGCFSYSCKKLRVLLVNGEFVYLDQQGNQLFGRTYSWATDFDGGYAVVCVEGDSYAVIDMQGEAIFTFDCKNQDKIRYSSQYKYLATADKDDKILIYNFKGEIVGIYPSKVESVYAFKEDCFIFANDDGYGLMNYKGGELIRAKYDQLVSNGNYYLAIHPDNDEEIRIIDEHENVLTILDGEEIYDLHALGYSFPNIIIRPDDEIYLIDSKGNAIGKNSNNFELDIDDIIYANQVPNLYFPQDRVLSIAMNLCGRGNGISIGQGAYFIEKQGHCHTTDVKFIKNSVNPAQFRGKYSASTILEQGVNYSVDFGVTFDEPIFRQGAENLNNSAWLTDITITITLQDIFLCASFFNVCKDRLIKLGCTSLYSNNNDHILLSNDRENVLVMKHNKQANTFSIIVNKENEDAINKWKYNLKNNK